MRLRVAHPLTPAAPRRTGAGSPVCHDHAMLPEGRLEQVLAAAVTQARAINGVEGVAVALCADEQLVCRAGVGTAAPQVGAQLSIIGSLSGICLSTGQTQFSTDTARDRRVDAAACEQLGARSVVLVALIEDDTILGIMEVLGIRPYAFGQREVKRMEEIADHLLNHLRFTAAGTAVQHTT